MAKQDFSGKAKKRDTYDKDWTFDRKQGAWVTQRQARDFHEEQLQAKREREAAAGGGFTATKPFPMPGTGTTAPIDTQGIGLSSTTAPVPTTPGSPSSTVPPWWINQAYTNPDENQAFANAANAILPTLSPEDQRNLASYLATNFKDVYGGYAQAQFAPIPTKITDERSQYLNPQRAQAALTLLDRMRQASGADEASMGKGYEFLKNALTLMNKYATSGPMTREQYDQFTSAISALSSQAGKDIGSYSNLAQLFNLPNFTAGPIVSNTANNRLNV
jgi:hypothetical protein